MAIVEVRDVSELIAIHDDIMGGVSDKQYILMNDIDLSVWGNWEPLGYPPEDVYQESFNGTFDGNGYTIFGLTQDFEKWGVGFFYWAENATIKNINFVDADVRGESGVGVVAGDVESSLVENVNVEGRVRAYGDLRWTLEVHANTGGLVGYGLLSEFKKCSFVGTIDTRTEVDGVTMCGSYVGGISGVNATRFEDCHVEGAIYGDNCVGGLCGTADDFKLEYKFCIAERCNVIADILFGADMYWPLYSKYSDERSSYNGGLIGIGGGARDCYVRGAFESQAYAGGWIGRLDEHKERSDGWYKNIFYPEVRRCISDMSVEYLPIDSSYYDLLPPTNDDFPYIAVGIGLGSEKKDFLMYDIHPDSPSYPGLYNSFVNSDKLGAVNWVEGDYANRYGILGTNYRRTSEQLKNPTTLKSQGFDVDRVWIVDPSVNDGMPMVRRRLKFPKPPRVFKGGVEWFVEPSFKEIKLRIYKITLSSYSGGGHYLDESCEMVFESEKLDISLGGISILDLGTGFKAIEGYGYAMTIVPYARDKAYVGVGDESNIWGVFDEILPTINPVEVYKELDDTYIDWSEV